MSHNYDDQVIALGAATDYYRLDADIDGLVNKMKVDCSTNTDEGSTPTNLLPAANNLHSMYFDGSSKYVTINYQQFSQGLDFPLSDHLSVECWVKPTADLSGADVTGVAQKPGAFGLYLTYGKPTFFIQSNGDGSRTTAVSSTALSSGSIYHLVGVYTPDDGTTHGHLYLYVNGSLVADTQCAYHKYIDKTGVTNFTVGSWDTSVLFFQGYISNLALYDGALTSTEVSANYGYSG